MTIETFYQVLVTWNCFAAPIMFFSLFTEWFSTWPRPARLGYSMAACGMLADVYLQMAHLNEHDHPIWALKDFGLGIVGWTFAFMYMVRKLHEMKINSYMATN